MEIGIKYSYPAKTKYSDISGVASFYKSNQGALKKLQERFPDGNYVINRKLKFVEEYEADTKRYNAATYIYVIPTENSLELSIGKDNLIKLIFVTPEKRYPLKRTYPIRRAEALWRFLNSINMLPSHIKTKDRNFIITFEGDKIENKGQLLFKLGKYA